MAAERDALKLHKSWSQSGNLITPGNGTPNFSSPVRLAAVFDEPGYYTVQIDILPPSVPVGSTNQAGDPHPVAIQGMCTVPVLAQAEVIWKNRGVNVRRVITVSQGASITGFGEGVDVTLLDQTPTNPGTGFTIPIIYSGSISIAKGSRGVTEQPPIQQALPSRVSLLTSGAIVYVPIPRNCGIISFRAYLVSQDTPPAAVVVAVQASDGYTILRNYDDVACTEGFVPLPPNATQLMFTDLSADHNYYLSLDWGIDG